jgi:hypothetical protein
MLNHEDQIQTHMKFRVFQSWDQSFTKFKKKMNTILAT